MLEKGKMMKKVGIILVNYNGLNDTIDCIHSIRKSNYGEYVIIVIDNASSEDASVLNSYDGVIYKRLEVNVGFGVANNIGAEIAVDNNCDYILCLNNDTIIQENTLRVLLENTNDETITTGAIYYYTEPNELWYGGGEVSKYKGNFRHKNYTSSRNVSFISGCCMMLSTKCYKDIGLFDSAYFMYYEDSDFSLKAIQNGYTLKYVYEAKIYHKVGKSISRTTGLKDYYLTRNRLYILYKYKSYFAWTSILYFYLTRIIYIVTHEKKNAKPIIDGIRDFKKGIRGAKQG